MPDTEHPEPEPVRVRTLAEIRAERQPLDLGAPS